MVQTAAARTGENTEPAEHVALSQRSRWGLGARAPEGPWAQSEFVSQR